MVVLGPRFPEVTEGPQCSETGQWGEACKDPDSASGLPEKWGPSLRRGREVWNLREKCPKGGVS